MTQAFYAHMNNKTIKIKKKFALKNIKYDKFLNNTLKMTFQAKHLK
jgi:hypothetical protein